jgi:hypothetical protein
MRLSRDIRPSSGRQDRIGCVEALDCVTVAAAPRFDETARKLNRAGVVDSSGIVPGVSPSGRAMGRSEPLSEDRGGSLAL